MRIAWHRSAELPSLKLWWYDDDDETLVDLSAVSSWSLKIGHPGSAALLTKTTGITGAAGSGSEPDGTPNVVVAWSAGELNLTPGAYGFQITATTASGDRVLLATIEIRDVIT